MTLSSIRSAITGRPPAATSPARRSPKPKPTRPVDALGRIAALAKAEEKYLALPTGGAIGPVVAEPSETMAPGTAPVTHRPDTVTRRDHALVAYGGREQVRGVPALLAWLAKVGVTVELVDGHLIASAPAGAVVDPVRDALALAAPLLRAHLAGKPLTCGMPGHPKGKAPLAATVAWPDPLPLCAEHATGELEP